MTMMTMKPVTSSNIQAVGYSKESKVLRVQFKSNSIYDYSDVPETVFNTLMATSSIGSFFNREIKNSYTTNKVSS